MITLDAATAPHRKIYPRRTRGPFQRTRVAINAVLQAILFVGPWITWHGGQAILLDVARRRFHFFGLTFWPQETYFVLIALIALALVLFASTAVAGRMWCGYACPQTLLTASFVGVEHFFEGDRARSLKLDRSPWSGEKLVRKSMKYAVWAGMALWLGITLVAYFEPASQVLAAFTPRGFEAVTVGLVLVFATLIYFDLGYFREQLCQYLCPYARFQSSMFDPDTLIIGYDRARGEPRGKPSQQDTGDCVDCKLCVQACPMGIDIRDGLQLECIACTACMDTCDSVMDKLSRPHGLIRYSSMNALQGKSATVLRPRVAVYGVLLLLLGSLFAYLLASRPLLSMDVVRGVTANVFARTSDGQVSNLYTLKLMNKDSVPHTVHLSVSGLPQSELVAAENPVTVAADTVVDVKVFVLHPPTNLVPVTAVTFQAADDQLAASCRSSFIGTVLSR